MATTWKIYDHPADHPDFYVARKWVTVAGEEPVAAVELGFNRLEEARQHVMWVIPGAVRSAPRSDEDPTLIESWH